jgi:hypothetical protein
MKDETITFPRSGDEFSVLTKSQGNSFSVRYL